MGQICYSGSVAFCNAFSHPNKTYIFLEYSTVTLYHVSFIRMWKSIAKCHTTKVTDLSKWWGKSVTVVWHFAMFFHIMMKLSFSWSTVLWHYIMKVSLGSERHCRHDTWRRRSQGFTNHASPQVPPFILLQWYNLHFENIPLVESNVISHIFQPCSHVSLAGGPEEGRKTSFLRKNSKSNPMFKPLPFAAPQAK